MEQHTVEKCDHCRKFDDMWYSLNPIHPVTLGFPTIFAHNGNLISYVNTKDVDGCEICDTAFNDCIYIKNGEYCTLFPYNEITVINCSIKKPLYHKNSIIESTDIGTFILPLDTKNLQDLLFLRGIKINPKQCGGHDIVYYSYAGIFESSKCNLQQCAFIVFCDDDKNIYLIDNKGNALEYETLQLTGEIFEDLNPGISSIPTDWQIYANNRIRVKVYGRFYGGHHMGFDKFEILEDIAPV